MRSAFVLPGVLAASLMVAYALGPPGVAEPLLQAAAWGSLLSYAVALRRRGMLTAPWVLIGCGYGLFAIGDLLFALNEHVWGIMAFPSTADIAYLAGYPLVAAGTAALVRRTRPGGDRVAVIDAGIIRRAGSRRDVDLRGAPVRLRGGLELRWACRERRLSALLSEADRAMYRAKDANGNQLVILRSA